MSPKDIRYTFAQSPTKWGYFHFKINNSIEYNMIEIKYNTRVFIDSKTSHIKIRVRWNKYETTFSLNYRAESTKWDNTLQRPRSGSIHKFDDQNCSARIINLEIDKCLDEIKTAFAKCELDGAVPAKDILRTMIRGEQVSKEVKLKKTLSELYEDFLKIASDDRNWTHEVHYKYKQMWEHMNECIPNVTIETLTKSKMRDLKNWYVDKGYSNVTIKKQFQFIKSFLRWLQNEGYEIQPGVLDYTPNLTVVPKTVTFLKYQELMDFYKFKFGDDEKKLELVRDLFCFMAFTSLRYSDLENLKKANVFEDHLEICTQKTRDKLCIPLTKYAKEIINKYKGESYKGGKMFHVYANQKINELLKIAAEKAGLDREVVLVRFQGTTRYEEIKKFHEIIGCHDARRTFVCCSLSFGIPTTVVMSCTGHSSYQAMRPYIEICDETQRKELDKWNQADIQSNIKNDIAKKLSDVDEDTLRKVLEMLNKPA